MVLIKLKSNKVIYVLILLLLGKVSVCQNEYFKQSFFNKSKNCKIFKSDYPKKNLKAYDCEKNVVYEGVKCFKFQLISKKEDESEYFIYNKPNVGLFLLNKANDKLNSTLLFNYADTISHTVDCGDLKHYKYQLSSIKAVKSDSIYIYKFTLFGNIVTNSHSSFWPINEIHVSKKYGINEIFYKDACLSFSYKK